MGDEMLIGHVDVMRQGSPKAVGRDKEHTGLFQVLLILNVSPDSDWRECFQNPREFQPNEAHPRLAAIMGDKLMFRSSEEHIERNIEWMDKYINQANECYRKKMAEKEEEIKKQEARSQAEKAELERINKMLARL